MAKAKVNKALRKVVWSIAILMWSYILFIQIYGMNWLWGASQGHLLTPDDEECLTGHRAPASINFIACEKDWTAVHACTTIMAWQIFPSPFVAPIIALAGETAEWSVFTFFEALGALSWELSNESPAGSHVGDTVIQGGSGLTIGWLLHLALGGPVVTRASWPKALIAFALIGLSTFLVGFLNNGVIVGGMFITIAVHAVMILGLCPWWFNKDDEAWPDRKYSARSQAARWTYWIVWFLIDVLLLMQDAFVEPYLTDNSWVQVWIWQWAIEIALAITILARGRFYLLKK